MAEISVADAPVRSRRTGRREGRWSWLAGGTTVSFGVSLATGLYLLLYAPANWTAGQIVLGCHLGAGVLAVVLFVAWVVEHVARGLRLAQDQLFLWSSWMFLGLYSALLASGLLIALPFFLYAAGIVWFYRFETTDLIATIHLYLALATAAGLLLHLALPHWRRRAAGR